MYKEKLKVKITSCIVISVTLTNCVWVFLLISANLQSSQLKITSVWQTRGMWGVVVV